MRDTELTALLKLEIAGEGDPHWRVLKASWFGEDDTREAFCRLRELALKGSLPAMEGLGLLHTEGSYMHLVGDLMALRDEARIWSAANLGLYVERLREAAAERAMKDRSWDTLNALEEGRPLGEIRAAMRSCLDGLDDGAEAASDVVGANEVLADTWRRVDACYGQSGGLVTGFQALDVKAAGLMPGNLIVVAGRPSMGKTSLVLSILRNLCLRGVKVGMLPLEEAPEDDLLKILCGQAGVDLHALRAKAQGPDPQEATRGDIVALGEASTPLLNGTLWFHRGRAVLSDLLASARRMVEEHGVQLLCLDYLGLILPDQRYPSKVQEVTEHSRAIKAVAVELGVPVILVCQLSRAPEARRDHRPMLSDLRDSGAIEQDADMVWFVYRPGLYDKRARHGNDVQVIVAKNRHGPTGTVKLIFDRPCFRFQELAGDEDWTGD